MMLTERVILNAISDGIWLDPGPEQLRALLGVELNLPDMELFETVARMHDVGAQVGAGGYADDPQFCMIPSSRFKVGDCDPRLALSDAIFIGGSINPGDDVFLVLDGQDGSADPNVMVFDWRKSVPNRWTVIMRLSALVRQLAKNPGVSVSRM